MNETTVKNQEAPRAGATARPLDSCGIVIFGASGDLTSRKLLPALYDLAHTGHLPKKFYILGNARREKSADQFREEMRQAVQEHGRFKPANDSQWKQFAQRLEYHKVDAKNGEDYRKLNDSLQELDRRHGTGGNHLFYLAVPPGLYAPIVQHMGRAGLAARGPQGPQWTRVVFEKPFGRDLESARALNRQVREAFEENQVYRIDHYLGKETVQNLAVFRFANSIFEPLWNRNQIDHIQISVTEDIGVGERAGYYDSAGAARDMVQNHILQVLSLVAMEPPAAFEAAAVRREKVKILESIRRFHPDRIEAVAVRGQYAPGQVNGKQAAGYRQESNVKDDSPTETFAAIRFEIDTWRWAGVPFYVRTGKRLARKASEINIQFREAPLALFACTAMQPCEPNLLTIRVQPDEGIGLRVITKTPGLDVIGRSVQLNFDYGAEFAKEAPTAYEALLLDALEGDPMLFAHGDWIEQSWQLLDPLLKAWQANPPKNFPNYPAGSWGPREGDELLEREGRRWLMS